MSAIDAAAPVAETLMLNVCLTATDAVAPLGADALAAVGVSASAITAPVLAASADGWRKAIGEILAIEIGRFFKEACLKVAVEQPKIEVEPDGAASLTLLPFEIASSHHPRIVVKSAAAVVPLNLDVELALAVEGARLHIANGFVVGASTGSAKGVARIGLLGGRAPLELGSPSFALPGRLTFAAPVSAQRFG